MSRKETGEERVPIKFPIQGKLNLGVIAMSFFHGTSGTGPYFEGWYWKHQNPRGQSLALIPAFHIDSGGRRTTSLQVVSKEQSWWLEYSEAQLQVSRQPLHIQVGQSSFGSQGITLHIRQGDLSLRGTLHYGPFTALQSDIMGPFRFLAGMQCSHGVISMRHSLGGVLELNGERLDFTDGIGYIETDRGAKIEMWSKSGAVIRQGKYRLEAELLHERRQALRAPLEGRMERTIHESLCAEVRYRFWHGTDLLLQHTDPNASFEYSAASRLN